ncbi:hypothetical protein ACFOSD_04800 [Salinispirillum marinum]|uniref:Uncharacterized protein n=2 Tax=Saccharospirillaceae TaxID=255527 RepID=A0ABV8BCI7_9GAMM
MNAYNIRQLKKMREQVASYQVGDLSLQSLIGDLIFLRDSLTETKDDWERELTYLIVDLESANTYALEKNNGKLDSMTSKIVYDALEKLAILIEKSMEA